jgi:hypothetical protein
MKNNKNSLFYYYSFTEKDAKKYPVISRILKQLTPERIKKEIEEVQKVELPAELQKWIKEYEKVGERNEYIWKWLYHVFQIVQLPGIPEKHQKFLWQTKVLLTIFVAQLDDIADKKQDKILLNEILKIPLNQKLIKFDKLNQTEKKYLKFTIKIWNYIKKTLKKCSRYKDFEEILDYDINQVFNAINYSHLLNKNLYLINRTESWLYPPHNMVAFVYTGLDLIHFPNFSPQILGPLREIIWRAQKMARIGNWVSTWEREVYENDFTSGVFAYAIDSEIITIGKLKQKNELEIIKKIKKAKIEKKLLKEWEQYYHEIEELSKKIENIPIKEFLLNLEKFIVLHLISRGYK